MTRPDHACRFAQESNRALNPQPHHHHTSQVPNSHELERLVALPRWARILRRRLRSLLATSPHHRHGSLRVIILCDYIYHYRIIWIDYIRLNTNDCVYLCKLTCKLYVVAQKVIVY